jgi:hypothetical protein
MHFSDFSLKEVGMLKVILEYNRKQNPPDISNEGWVLGDGEGMSYLRRYSSGLFTQM